MMCWIKLRYDKISGLWAVTKLSVTEQFIEAFNCREVSFITTVAAQTRHSISTDGQDATYGKERGQLWLFMDDTDLKIVDKVG